eukprot:CAMPEP_0113851228 /NCGR_PEP_ID=MMETSP0372-20130328/4464_1 /TAXON_ID=340204 /ORGANISM="Lankesteria abbotti" /LENGTH=157 /DNA_ID=CAMNT_0000821895 /DNA_START=56 /DNA_END=529 /DNA_ORIENTATION=- /assembly_acc=CAM_ASM_000359
MCCESLTKALWARAAQRQSPRFNDQMHRIRRGLTKLLEMYPGGIVLSQVRTIYSAHIGEQLDFNCLGYTKLAVFLKEQMSDCCVTVPTGMFNLAVFPKKKLHEETGITKSLSPEMVNVVRREEDDLGDGDMSLPRTRSSSSYDSNCSPVGSSVSTSC